MPDQISLPLSEPLDSPELKDSNLANATALFEWIKINPSFNNWDVENIKNRYADLEDLLNSGYF